MVLILLTVATVTGGLIATVRRHAPSNILLRWMLTQRRLRWAVPVGLAGGTAYTCLALLATHLADRSGIPALYVVAVLGVYNAVRFALTIPIALIRLLVARHRERR